MMLVIATVLQSCDYSFGKVDKNSLPQHTLLELFTECLENKPVINLAANNQQRAKWDGLVFSTADGDTSIFEIHWGHRELRGNVAFQWLPQTIRKLYLIGNMLEGTIDTSLFPPVMELLQLADNRFIGDINFQSLPEALERMWLKNNALSGPLDFSQLPGQLTFLDLSRNNFSGECDFSQLPSTLEHLNLSNNVQLSGSLHVGKGKSFFAVNTNVKIV